MSAGRRLAAIMFTDMVGYSASVQDNERVALERLKQEEALVRPILARHQGREIKSTGDGFLVEFESALRAVECALDIQSALHDYNARSGEPPIELRVGVHLGDVEERGSDIFGDAVNVAARIEPLASPGGVCVSGPVFELVRNKIPNQFEKLPPTSLKNIRVPVDLYRVALPWQASEAGAAESPRTRLAVLPLVNISPDPADAYFADGMTEELTAVLSKVKELQVVARTSVAQYRATTKPVTQIGSELDVGTVLEGSVRKAGRRLRITLQLIDARSQAHLWSENYDRDLEDVFAIQSDVAERTAGALRIALVAPVQDSIRLRPTNSLRAYNVYLKALAKLWAPDAEAIGSLQEAEPLLKEAIQLDPEFGLAYAQLANSYIALSGESMTAAEAFPRARELLAQAVKYAPRASEVHTALGNLALQDDHDWALAEKEFLEAIEANPSNAEARLWYSLLLRVQLRLDEAREQILTVLKIAPAWDRAMDWLAGLEYLAGNFAEALSIVEAARPEARRQAIDHLNLALYLDAVGRTTEAGAEAAKAAGPAPAMVRGYRAAVLAKLGHPEEAREILQEYVRGTATTFVEPSRYALVFAALGEHERAIEALNKGETGDNQGSFWFWAQSPAFDSLRSDPRFQALLRKYRLPIAAAPGNQPRRAAG